MRIRQRYHAQAPRPGDGPGTLYTDLISARVAVFRVCEHLELRGSPHRSGAARCRFASPLRAPLPPVPHEGDLLAVQAQFADQVPAQRLDHGGLPREPGVEGAVTGGGLHSMVSSTSTSSRSPAADAGPSAAASRNAWASFSLIRRRTAASSSSPWGRPSRGSQVTCTPERLWSSCASPASGTSSSACPLIEA